MNAEQIAAKLVSAEKRALIECPPLNVEVKARIAMRFCRFGLLQDSIIGDDCLTLTPLGLEVRAILEKQP